MKAAALEPNPALKTEPFLLEVADAVNTTLDLDTMLRRVADLLRRAIDYDVFAVLLLNEKAGELRIRFHIGHPPEIAEKLRIKVGEGVTGRAAKLRQPVLVDDVASDSHFIDTDVGTRSELA